jgi:hypothetical protein
VAADRLTEEEITPNTYYGQEEDASPFYDTLRQIHAQWLMTQLDDLGGKCPREVALERRGHLTWDLQDRCDQWTLMGKCPPGLAETTHAFRYGGFGTHELVEYYELVRALLWSCWRRLEDLAQSPNPGHRPDALTAGDFLTTEVPRLEAVREAWLDEPDPECHGRTPRSVIARERARLPEGLSGREAMIDPDCPCCQMMADMHGPMFWGLDGSSMDDDFAFDIYNRTREEWDESQRRSEEFHLRFAEEREECKRLGVASSRPAEDGSNAVWSRSFSVGDTADVPLGIRVFGVGCRLAELIVGLRDGADREATPPQVQQQIDRLNRDFGNLREVLESADASLAASLFDPVVDRFVDTLDDVAEAREDLEMQCESLTDELRELLAPSPPMPEGLIGDWDGEIPF